MSLKRKRGNTTAVIKSSKACWATGNRWRKAYGPHAYLTFAYGLSEQKFKPAMARSMRACVAISVMGLQLHILAKIASWMQKEKAAFMIIRKKWDEASNLFRVKLKNFKTNNTSSVWAVMIYRVRLTIHWASGRSVLLNLVMPPTLMTGKSAADMWNQLRFHPIFEVVHRALEHMKTLTELHMELAEVFLSLPSDRASA